VNRILLPCDGKRETLLACCFSLIFAAHEGWRLVGFVAVAATAGAAVIGTAAREGAEKGVGVG
jgi:hypothetical protein